MKRIIAILLSLSLLFGTALHAFGFAYGEEGDPYEDFGIAKGYVRTKQVTKDNIGHYSRVTSSYNQQGKLLKKTDVSDGDGYQNKTVIQNTYDKKGRLTKTVCKEYGSVYTSIYSYDKHGNEIKCVNKTVDSDGARFTSTTVKTYDKKNRLIESVYSSEYSTETKTYTYNKAGKVVKETDETVDNDGDRTKDTTTYTYDKAGNMIKMANVSYSSYTGTRKHTITDEYNDKGQLVKSTDVHKSDGGTDRETYEYTYDAKGNNVKGVVKSFYADGSTEAIYISSTYNAKGQLTKRVNDVKIQWGSGKHTNYYTYDSKGRMIKDVYIFQGEDGSTSKSVSQYSYDKAGNLLKVVFKNQDGMRETTTFAYQKIGA